MVSSFATLPAGIPAVAGDGGGNQALDAIHQCTGAYGRATRCEAGAVTRRRPGPCVPSSRPPSTPACGNRGGQEPAPEARRLCLADCCSRPTGSTSPLWRPESGPERPARGRAGGGSSRSAPRSGAGRGGTRPGASARSGSPGASSGAARRAWPGARPAGPRPPLVCEPDRQAPALTQAGVVLGPVGDPVPLPRDAVAAGRVGLERHGRGQGVMEGAAPLRHLIIRRHLDQSVQGGAALPAGLRPGPQSRQVPQQRVEAEDALAAAARR